MFSDRLKMIQQLAANKRDDISSLKLSISKLQEAVGRIEARQLNSVGDVTLNTYEFRVYSQWGEDGIIQYLVGRVKITRNIFVEFGVENYTESNTRFLLINNNWSGLVIDGSKEQIRGIITDPIYWQYNLKAVNSFVTRDNINDLLVDNGIEGEVGLLSIDIDGNDYWVWQAINVIQPCIVIAEYNHRFGADKAVTVPYDADFVRQKAHHSNIYYGASLKALVNLGKRKGYSFVGCNSAGNNAFFVRRDLLSDLHEMSAQGGFVAGKFRESRDERGKLLFLSPEEEYHLLAGLPLVDVES